MDETIHIMKVPITAVIFLISIAAFAQDTVFPDLHGDKESFAKVKDKTLHSELATFTDAGSGQKKTSVKVIEVPLVKYSSVYSQFGNDSCQFKLSITKFKKSSHKISYIDSF